MLRNFRVAIQLAADEQAGGIRKEVWVGGEKKIEKGLCVRSQQLRNC